MNSKFSMLGVPIDCIGMAEKPGGTELSPAVLREHALVEALSMQDCGDLPVRIDRNHRDPASGIVGFDSVCRTTQAIRQAVRQTLAAGEHPFLVGGCCTELIGAVAGAKDHFGVVGLAYLDGHIDLYDGRTSPTGEAADIPVAALLGYGPAGLLDQMPVIKPQHLALLAYRDLEEARANRSLLPDDIKPAMMHYDVEKVRMRGAGALGEQVALALAHEPGQYWLHLDFDILDQKVFPATDYLMAGGLDWPELVALARPLCSSPHLIGMSIACYNPDKDPQRECATSIVSALRQIFASPD